MLQRVCTMKNPTQESSHSLNSSMTKADLKPIHHKNKNVLYTLQQHLKLSRHFFVGKRDWCTAVYTEADDMEPPTG